MIIETNTTDKETQTYVDYLKNKYNRKIKSLKVTVDGDFADLEYEFEPTPFERIRRITGYLVGSMEHWNNAKTSEEQDRVKHSTSEMETL